MSRDVTNLYVFVSCSNARVPNPSYYGNRTQLKCIYSSVSTTGGGGVEDSAQDQGRRRTQQSWFPFTYHNSHGVWVKWDHPASGTEIKHNNSDATSSRENAGGKRETLNISGKIRVFIFVHVRSPTSGTHSH